MAQISALQDVVSRDPDEGEARWWMGSLAIIKATSSETAGQFTLVEIVENEGETPLHVHHNEDEAFWVLEGEIDFEVGGKQVTAMPSSFLFGPRGIPHRYTVRRGPARMLFILTPGGFEGLIRDTSRPATERRIPVGEEGMPDLDALPTIAERYGCELLG
ncbi:cupin domain-containing protein [Mesorhizobium microcysteis]|uniref:Cupin domain-containing protein n=1 Tax=Neoaquamicrobium microcysteis TaxID=2682781 RepID=A0A5D4HC96_9HYPH|nr:cupin domain-containing protein [Mesorhizobium microcysteis]TYR37155.1 cupin domain-containing protein [Mesorhizobium microcysteis]